VLHDFAVMQAPYGSGPEGVIRDEAGNFYGATGFGGAWGAGVVYKVDTSGQETVLYTFTGGADGGDPNSGLIRDDAGNLYGTTSSGGNPCEGMPGCGVVYKIDTAGHETVLYAFSGPDGEIPLGLIRDSAGNLYGTTVRGGAVGYGVVFELDTAGRETILHSFAGGADGSFPNAGLVLDSGYLYGTTSCGGTGTGCSGGGAGLIYKLDFKGHETVLFNFTGGSDGCEPLSGVVPDAAGNLYGTTEFGGSAAGTAGMGVVYKLNPSGQETVLYTFPGGAHGGYPRAGVIFDSAGNLFGTTGGSTGAAGVVFMLNASGQQTVLHVFSGGADGGDPTSGVIRDAAGNLLGTAGPGNAEDGGVIYEVEPDGQETVLYAFPAEHSGANPQAGLWLDSAGNLYGTTAGPGGTVFKVDPSEKYTTLYFFSSELNGRDPKAGVTRDSAGNIYGTTNSGGAKAAGEVYKLNPAGNQTVLYSFAGHADGGNPIAGVTLDSADNLYGTAYEAGIQGCFEYIGCGVVYKVDPSGHETVLYSFTGGADGGNPVGGVILDPAGNLYGTTTDGGTPFGQNGNGVVFKLSPSGQLTVLYTFTGGADGSTPNAGVIRDSAGNLYGTTYQGGAGYGVVFKLNPSGQETVLYTFTGGPDGGNPIAGVVLDSAGNLYGTTAAGGTSTEGFGRGVVFMLNPSGQEKVLHTFMGPPDGSTPYGGVVLDSAGNVYGTTDKGGMQKTGVIFKLTPQ
jgi:uncharacterized repeat protein (TIGR03803 family)